MNKKWTNFPYIYSHIVVRYISLFIVNINVLFCVWLGSTGVFVMYAFDIVAFDFPCHIINV